MNVTTQPGAADPHPSGPADWRRAARVLRFRGHDIAWHDSGGDGPPVLLLHGFPTASWDWHRVWPALARKHRLVAPDLIGFGHSAKPAEFPYSIRAQADLCEDLLDAAGVSRFSILAHDYGVTVAQELLARCLDADGCQGARSVLFLNGGLFPEVYRPRLVQRLLAGPFGDLFVPLLGRRLGGRSIAAVFSPTRQPSAAELDDLWSLIEHGGGRRLIPRLLRYMDERRANRKRWVGALERAPVPIMLVNGEADPVSGSHVADRWEALLPGRPVVRLPDTGHWPQLENPEAVIGQALSFLAG